MLVDQWLGKSAGAMVGGAICRRVKEPRIRIQDEDCEKAISGEPHVMAKSPSQWSTCDRHRHFHTFTLSHFHSFTPRHLSLSLSGLCPEVYWCAWHAGSTGWHVPDILASWHGANLCADPRFNAPQRRPDSFLHAPCPMLHAPCSVFLTPCLNARASTACSCISPWLCTRPSSLCTVKTSLGWMELYSRADPCNSHPRSD